MIATIRTWNGFHSGNNVTKIGNVCHLLHFFQKCNKIIMFDCYASVVCIYQKICYFKMRIIFQFKSFLGENKIHWNNDKVVTFPIF